MKPMTRLGVQLDASIAGLILNFS